VSIKSLEDAPAMFQTLKAGLHSLKSKWAGGENNVDDVKRMRSDKNISQQIC